MENDTVSMNYEIRGLIEENMEWLLDVAAQTVGTEPNYWKLPDDIKHQIALDTAFCRLMGFHGMWCMIEGNEPEDDFGQVIINMIHENRDWLIHAVSEYEQEARENYNSEIPDYGINVGE